MAPTVAVVRNYDYKHIYNAGKMGLVYQAFPTKSSTFKCSVHVVLKNETNCSSGIMCIGGIIW